MRLHTITVAVLILLGITQGIAQGITGTEFLFSLPENFRHYNYETSPNHPKPEISCCVSSRTPVDVTIRFNEQNSETIVHAEPGKPAFFLLPESSVISSTDSIERKSISIRSPRPVSVTVGFYKFQTTESFTVLPKNYYGTEYRIASYNDLAPDLRGVATITARRHKKMNSLKKKSTNM